MYVGGPDEHRDGEGKAQPEFVAEHGDGVARVAVMPGVRAGLGAVFVAILMMLHRFGRGRGRGMVMGLFHRGPRADVGGTFYITGGRFRRERCPDGQLRGERIPR